MYKGQVFDHSTSNTVLLYWPDSQPFISNLKYIIIIINKGKEHTIRVDSSGHEQNTEEMTNEQRIVQIIK